MVRWVGEVIENVEFRIENLECRIGTERGFLLSWFLFLPEASKFEKIRSTNIETRNKFEFSKLGLNWVCFGFAPDRKASEQTFPCCKPSEKHSGINCRLKIGFELGLFLTFVRLVKIA